jgi:hypothetical protein
MGHGDVRLISCGRLNHKTCSTGKNSHTNHIHTHLLYQKVVPSRCDHGGIAITIRSCQNNHFAFCSWSVILFAWWFEAVPEQPACSVGAIPTPYKKISDMAQISEQPTDI